MLPWAHPSPQLKRHLDPFSHFCTVHVRVPSGMSRRALPLKIAPSHGGSVPPSNMWFLAPPDLSSQTASRSGQPFLHSSRQKVPVLYNGRRFLQNSQFPCGNLGPSWYIHDSLGPSKPTTQTASPSVQPFLHRCPQSVPILSNGRPLSIPKIAPSNGGIWTPSNTWFHGPTRVLKPNGISIGSAVFAGLHCDRLTDRPTDRLTDHAIRSVKIGRIYVRSTAMRPNNNIHKWSK